MRHPFDGIVTTVQPSRRSWLAALATLGGLVFGSRLFAAAPPARSAGDDVDPEPKKKKKPEEKPLTRGLREQGGAMTRALNENGGPRVTTLALNEEGGKK